MAKNLKETYSEIMNQKPLQGLGVVNPMPESSIYGLQNLNLENIPALAGAMGGQTPPTTGSDYNVPHIDASEINGQMTAPSTGFLDKISPILNSLLKNSTAGDILKSFQKPEDIQVGSSNPYLGELYRMKNTAAQGNMLSPATTNPETTFAPIFAQLAGQQIAADTAKAGQGITSKDRWNAASDFRKEFKADPVIKDFVPSAGFYKNAVETSKKPGKGQALTMLYSYAKMMDPGGRVTASDIESGQNVGTLPDRVQGWISQYLTSGKTLGPEQLKALMQEIESAYAGKYDQYSKTKSQYDGIAKSMGLDPAISNLDIQAPPSGSLTGFIPKGSTLPKADANTQKVYEAAKKAYADPKTSPEDKEIYKQAIIEYDNKYR